MSTNESISIHITQTKHKIMNLSFLCVYEWVDFNLRHTKKKKLDACVYISVSTNESISLVISQKKWIDTCVYFYVSTNDWVSIIILASRMVFRNSQHSCEVSVYVSEISESHSWSQDDNWNPVIRRHIEIYTCVASFATQLRSVCLCVWSRLDKIYQYVCLSL